MERLTAVADVKPNQFSWMNDDGGGDGDGDRWQYTTDSG